MKLYASLLTLSAITGASAFVAQPTAFAKSTSLRASYSYIGDADDKPTAVNPDSSLAVAEEPDPIDTVISSLDLWKSIDTIRVQGDTLKTCSFEEGVERVEVLMKSGGRPLNANVELWQGHCNDPQRIRVYLEDGEERTFRAVLECPGSSNSVSIRNIATQEYPLNVGLEADFGGVESAGSPADILRSLSSPRIVQGGAVYTLAFDPAVQSIQIMLKSDGRPMNARVELLQGPNNVKQSVEIYSEDGDARAFYSIFDAPGAGNMIRIVNTATVEYPLEAFIEPYIVDDSFDDTSSGMQWR